MAMVWKVRVVPIEDAHEGLGTWEPFAVVEDEDKGPCVVVKGLFEEEGPKSSVHEENRVDWER